MDITNVCDCWVYLSRSDPAEALAGIPLAPWGGSYHIGTNNMWEGPIWAICVCDESKIVIPGNYCTVAISEGSRPR